MLSRRTRGISTSWSGGAVLVSSCPYSPPRCRGRVVVRCPGGGGVRTGRSSWSKLVWSENWELFERLFSVFLLEWETQRWSGRCWKKKKKKRLPLSPDFLGLLKPRHLRKFALQSSPKPRG